MSRPSEYQVMLALAVLMVSLLVTLSSAGPVQAKSPYAGALDLDQVAATFAAERVPTFPAMTGTRVRPRHKKSGRRRGPIKFDSTLPLPITRGDR